MRWCARLPVELVPVDIDLKLVRQAAMLESRFKMSYHCSCSFLFLSPVVLFRLFLPGSTCENILSLHIVRIRCSGATWLMRVFESDLPGLNALPGTGPQAPPKQQHADDCQQHQYQRGNHCVHLLWSPFVCLANSISCVAMKCSKHDVHFSMGSM